MNVLIVVVIVAIAIILLITISNIIDDDLIDYNQSEIEAAGRNGERIATDVIRGVIRETDCLLTNVNISYDGRNAELDNVIINKYGVFIIEVKYYTGKLYGTEDSSVWEKVRYNGYRKGIGKSVKNPIKQVRRQTYLLAKYLNYYGVSIWVEGYVYLVNRNSPIRCKYILETTTDIDKAIHTFDKNRLNKKTVERAKYILSPD